MSATEALVLLLGAALAGALLVLLPQWRELMHGGRALPIFRYLGKRAPFEAELRCALCAERQECERRTAPLPDCPNLELLEQRKVA